MFDGLKKTEVSILVARARNIVIEARTPKIMELIKKRTGLYPIKDQDTRWGSTFIMLDRLLKLQDIIQEMQLALVILS